MIIKYYKDGSWGFIDNVRQVAHKDIATEGAVSRYNLLQKDMPYETNSSDPAEYMDGKRLPDNVVTSNKVFSMVCYDMADEGVNRHSENLIDPEQIDMPVTAILLYIEECKEYDAILLVTNQKAYLLNDKGQTIERLN
jgi:hypothetical protein